MSIPVDVLLVAIDLVAGGTSVLGIAILSAAVAAGVAVTYRWYTKEAVPTGLGLLIALAVVAAILNTTTVLGQVMVGTRGLLDLDDAVVNTVMFVVAGGAALVGVRAGDQFARASVIISGARELDVEVGRLVQAVGRVISVTIPEEEAIEDLEGYDPVPAVTKEAVAGKTLLFPRRLTVDELRSRLIERLKEDYGVGHVGVELAEDGSVEYLGLGSRAAGIGPTLAPGTAATAVRADPAFAATSGDIVQLWRGTEEPTQVTTGELRAAVDDLVTLALDEPDAEALDPTVRYRLVTLPTGARPDREFAALLRASDETMGVIEIKPGSPLDGTSVGSLDPTVVAVRLPGGEIEAIPPRGHVIAAGETLYAIARPEVLRRLEAAAASEAQPSS